MNTSQLPKEAHWFLFAFFFFFSPQQNMEIMKNCLFFFALLIYSSVRHHWGLPGVIMSIMSIKRLTILQEKIRSYRYAANTFGSQKRETNVALNSTFFYRFSHKQSKEQAPWDSDWFMPFVKGCSKSFIPLLCMQKEILQLDIQSNL